MSDVILQQLEDKIDSLIETTELLRLQIEELETKNSSLVAEGSKLKNKQNSWEKNLSQMIQKLDIIENKGSQSERVTITEEIIG